MAVRSIENTDSTSPDFTKIDRRFLGSNVQKNDVSTYTLNTTVPNVGGLSYNAALVNYLAAVPVPAIPFIDPKITRVNFRIQMAFTQPITLNQAAESYVGTIGFKYALHTAGSLATAPLNVFNQNAQFGMAPLARITNGAGSGYGGVICVDDYILVSALPGGIIPPGATISVDAGLGAIVVAASGVLTAITDAGAAPASVNVKCTITCTLSQ